MMYTRQPGRTLDCIHDNQDAPWTVYTTTRTHPGLGPSMKDQRPGRGGQSSVSRSMPGEPLSSPVRTTKAGEVLEWGGLIRN